MIVVPVKEGENIEKALKKFKRKFEKTGVIKELRNRQAYEKPSVTNRKKMMRAIYVQKMQQADGIIAGKYFWGTRNEKRALKVGIFKTILYIRSSTTNRRVCDEVDRVIFKIRSV